jgi:hypothetical protein
MWPKSHSPLPISPPPTLPPSLGGQEGSERDGGEGGGGGAEACRGREGVSVGGGGRDGEATLPAHPPRDTPSRRERGASVGGAVQTVTQPEAEGDLGDLYRFDTSALAWTNLTRLAAGPGPSRREFHGFTAGAGGGAGSLVFVFGGNDDRGASGCGVLFKQQTGQSIASIAPCVQLC